MAETLFNTMRAVVERPAAAALSTHLIRTADPANRAQVNSALANQNKVLHLLNLAVRLLVVSLMGSAGPGSVWAAWSLLSLLLLPLEAYQVHAHRPLTFNRERFTQVLKAWDATPSDLSQLSPGSVAARERLVP